MLLQGRIQVIFCSVQTLNSETHHDLLSINDMMLYYPPTITVTSLYFQQLSIIKAEASQRSLDTKGQVRCTENCLPNMKVEGKNDKILPLGSRISLHRLTRDVKLYV